MFDLENIKKYLDKKIKVIGKSGRMLRENISKERQRKKDNFIQGVLDDLEKNHNHSWYQELYIRNKDSLDDIALFYRGTEITYGEMFEKMREYAKSLKALGVDENSEIPICMSNSPEFIYLLGAISIVGAKANIFGADYDKDYIKKLISECNSDIMFVEDNYYEEISNSIPKPQIKKVFVTSLARSLSDKYEQYRGFDVKHSKLFVDKTSKYTSSSDGVYLLDDFIHEGESYTGNIYGKSGLDNDFTVTYSSGTTSNKPKPIVHTTRSFITIGRCHDPEIQKTTSMKKFTIMAHVPTFSNTNVISSISDSLMQGSRLALEPIYEKEFFLDSLLINKPNYVVASKSFWLYAMKEIFYNPMYRGTKLPFLTIPFAAGEGLDRGEEKFINKGLRKVSAGKDLIPIPVSPITISVAGGDCEHGGIFWLLFRSLQSKMPSLLLRNDVHGMNAFEMVDYAVLDRDGKYCGPYQYGRLVANSPCTMKEYKNNLEATAAFFIKDAYGKEWGDCNVYCYLDSSRSIHMKGRIPKTDEEIPPFVYSDVITLDTKNILSCEVVDVDGVYVAHIEPQPDSKLNILDIIASCEERCLQKLGREKTEKLVYKIHGIDGFKLTHSGKRDTTSLLEEGVSDECLKPVFVGGREISFLSAKDYLCTLDKVEKDKTLKK